MTSSGQHYDHLLKLLLIGDSGACGRRRRRRRAWTTTSAPGGACSTTTLLTDVRALCHAARARATGVGKSCLLLRFSDDQFTTSFITTIGCVRAFAFAFAFATSAYAQRARAFVRPTRRLTEACAHDACERVRTGLILRLKPWSWMGSA